MCTHAQQKYGRLITKISEFDFLILILNLPARVTFKSNVMRIKKDLEIQANATKKKKKYPSKEKKKRTIVLVPARKCSESQLGGRVACKFWLLKKTR